MHCGMKALNTDKRTAPKEAAKMTPGSGSFNFIEGKRKANGELVKIGESSKEVSGFKGEGVSVESPNELGLFKEGTNKGYEGPVSIKGKKVLARLRAAPINSRSADSKEVNKARKVPKTIWSPTNAHLPSDNNGEFLFLSKSRNEMGNMLEGNFCENPNGGDQPQVKGSMEMDFTTNTSECKIGQPSAIGPSVGSKDDRGVEEANWGVRSSDLDAVCNRSEDVSLGKEMAGQFATCNQAIGQHNGFCEEDGMEFDGGGEAPVSRQ